MVEETASLSGESVYRTHMALDVHKPTYSGIHHQSSSQKGVNSIKEVEDMSGNRARAQQMALFSLSPLPHIQCYKVGCHTLLNTSGLSFTA